MLKLIKNKWMFWVEHVFKLWFLMTWLLCCQIVLFKIFSLPVSATHDIIPWLSTNETQSTAAQWIKRKECTKYLISLINRRLNTHKKQEKKGECDCFTNEKCTLRQYFKYIYILEKCKQLNVNQANGKKISERQTCLLMIVLLST